MSGNKDLAEVYWRRYEGFARAEGKLSILGKIF